MSEKSKILFIPMCLHGHINYLLPIARKFIHSHGDKIGIHFALDEEFTEKVKKLIPKAHFTVYESPFKKQFAGNAIAEVMQKFGETWSDDLVKYVHSSASMMQMQLDMLIEIYPTMTKIIEDIKPSLIIFDQLLSPAFGKDKNIPWVNVVSAAMNFTALEKMPPTQSGLPEDLTPENVKKWNLFIEQAYKEGPFVELVKNNSQHLKDKGLTGLDGQYYFFHLSPYLNIYGYPKELDYQEEEGRKLPGNWCRIESPVVSPICPPFPVPDKLKNLPEKGLGRRLNAFDSDAKIKKDLEDAIEYCSQESVINRMKMASQRIQKDTGLDSAFEEILKLIRN